ncbi:MAG: hypothetical protein ACRDJG_12710 [Actinomycetota bacterium]
MAGEPPAGQVGADGALRDPDPMTGEEDLGDMGRRAGGTFSPQGGGLREELGVPSHRSGIRSAQRREPAEPRAR